MPVTTAPGALVTSGRDWTSDEDASTAGTMAAAGTAGTAGTELSKQARLTAWVRGRVQGVGFRWWVRSNALELGLLGIAENLLDGRVKIVAEGNRDSCAALLDRLDGPDAPGYVVQVTHRWDQARGGLIGFVERLAGLCLAQAADQRERQLDRTPLGWDHSWVTCAQPGAFQRFCVRAHSGHSVWRTSSNGEGSAWPCWRA
jgi:acylphosphatase